MDYGIPIPKTANIKSTKTLTLLTNVDYDTALENVFNNLVEELGVDAYKSDWVGGGDDSYTYYSLNLPNFYNASGVVVSWESLIGLVFDDFHNSVPSINTKWTTGWSRMYYNTEPDIFFCIRPQDNSNDLGMNGSRIAYYDDRVIVFAEYIFRDGNKNNNFKIVMDFKKNVDSFYGVDTNIYYMASGNNLNPYVWAKLFKATDPTYIEVLSADRNILNFQNGSYALTKYDMTYDNTTEYINNIKFDIIQSNTSFKQKLNFKNNSILNLTRVKERTYHEIVNRRAIDWIPRNYNPLSFNISEKFGDIITNNKRPSQHLVDTQKISLLYNYIDVKGFIEGKTNEDKIYAKFLNSADYGVLQVIDSFEYDFRLYSSYSNFLLLVDGRLRKIDIKNKMLKGYISGKINTSGCSGQDFIIRCYRHSNNDFIGEYKVDSSGSYFIPNLNHLDEYDIMLVDKNSVIETKVSSKRKPILNDEIKSQKIEVHTSSLNMDISIDFSVVLLDFRFDRNVYPYIIDDAQITPKPYTNYYNLSTSYYTMIYFDNNQNKYYMNSHAHVADVRYSMTDNRFKETIKKSEWEIEINFDHWGHSYSQWNSLFSCSDTVHGGNFMFIYQNKLRFEMVDKTNGKNYEITTTDDVPAISTNRVYNLKIIRTKDSIKLYLDKMLYSQVAVPNDFDFNFDIIKIGCAWNGSQYWGNYYDFKFRIL